MKEQINWLFSTSLQVLATFVGLLAAGFFFTHGRIEEELQKDETLLEIYAEIKVQFFRRIRTLFMLTGSSIILGLGAIFLNAFDKGLALYVFFALVAVLNIFTIIWAGRFFLFMIDPEMISHSADRLVRENSDIFSQRSVINSVSKKDFMGKFGNLDKLLRDIAEKTKSNTDPQKQLSLGEIIKDLFEKNIISQEQLRELNQVNKARNIGVHSNVNSIENQLATTTDKLNTELNIIRENKVNPQK